MGPIRLFLGNPKSAEHIPRPPNSWFLFLLDFERLCTKDGVKFPDRVSLIRAASERWGELPVGEKRVYYDQEQREKVEHAQKYPGYQYQPKKNLKTEKGRKRKKPRPKHLVPSDFTPPSPAPSAPTSSSLNMSEFLVSCRSLCYACFYLGNSAGRTAACLQCEYRAKIPH